MVIALNSGPSKAPTMADMLHVSITFFLLHVFGQFCIRVTIHTQISLPLDQEKTRKGEGVLITELQGIFSVFHYSSFFICQAKEVHLVMVN